MIPDYELIRQVKFSVTGLTFSSKKDYLTPVLARSRHRTKRKAVEAFSKKSIAGFRALWRSLDFTDYLEAGPNEEAGRGFHLTLNCPPDSNPSQVTFKRLKDALQKALLAEFDNLLQGIIWKAERQEATGTPHLHLVLFLADRRQRSAVSACLKEIWTRLVKDTSGAFRRYGIKVQTLYGDPGLPKLRGYLEKQPVAPEQEWNLGRVWGQWLGDRLPIRCPVKADIPMEQFYRHKIFLEVLKTHPATCDLPKVKKLTTQWMGFSLDGLTPDEIASIQETYLLALAKIECW